MSLAVLRQLDKLANDASRIPYINWGGCGVFASMVAERLHALGIPVWGVVSEDCADKDLNEVRLTAKPKNTVPSWNAAGVWFKHILVQFALDGKIWTYDTSGVVAGSPEREATCGGKLYAGNLTVQELKELAGNPRGWSPTFNRVRIPDIEALINEHLSIKALTS